MTFVNKDTKDPKVSDALDRTQAQAILDHLIQKTQTLQKDAQKVQETAELLKKVLAEHHSHQGQQSHIDEVFKKAN